MCRADQHDSAREEIAFIQRDSGREQQTGGNRNGIVLSNKPVFAREPWPDEQPMSGARKQIESLTRGVRLGACGAHPQIAGRARGP